MAHQISEGWQRVAVCCNQNATHSDNIVQNDIKTTLHYVCGDNNNFVLDRGFGKSHLKLLN